MGRGLLAELKMLRFLIGAVTVYLCVDGVERLSRLIENKGGCERDLDCIMVLFFMLLILANWRIISSVIQEKCISIFGTLFNTYKTNSKTIKYIA